MDVNEIEEVYKEKFRLFNFLKRGLIRKRDFNAYKNRLDYVINKIRKLYYMKKFYNSRDSKDLWSNINSILKRGRKSETIKIKQNDVLVYEDQLPNLFNHYFTSIASDLVTNLPLQVDWLNINNNIQSIPHSFVFLPTCCTEIFEIIKSLPNKGNSLFDIKPNILRMISDFICPVLAFLYNKCIVEDLYPNVLKRARVVPIFKSGNNSILNNFRPISNLISLNKIFELLTYNRMISFIDYHDIISPNQYGFRKGMNTTLAIFNLVTDLLETFNKRLYTVALFLDLRKAFDTVNYDILLHKLNLYGFRGVGRAFIGSYLEGRCQYVNVNNKKSDFLNVSVGVPQ